MNRYKFHQGILRDKFHGGRGICSFEIDPSSRRKWWHGKLVEEWLNTGRLQMSTLEIYLEKVADGWCPVFRMESFNILKKSVLK